MELADCHATALDIDEGRLNRVKSNLDRLGFQTVSLACADAQDLAAWYDGQAFDAVLADVPCTASGVARRNPDVKWLRRPTDAVKTARQQEALLDALWQTLTKNGRMLLATCSVFVEKTTVNCKNSLNRHADAELIESHVLLPNKHQDGFYYALIKSSKTLIVPLLLAVSLNAAGEGISATRAEAKANPCRTAFRQQPFPHRPARSAQRSTQTGCPLHFNLSWQLSAPSVASYKFKFDQLLNNDSTIQYKLSFHPLTNRYRVTVGTFSTEYDTLEAALRAVGAVAEWKVLSKGALSEVAAKDTKAEIRLLR